MELWNKTKQAERDDVWRYRDMWPETSGVSTQLVLGDTVLGMNLFQWGVRAETLWVQREDHNPFGSHKDRSLRCKWRSTGKRGFDRSAFRRRGMRPLLQQLHAAKQA